MLQDICAGDFLRCCQKAPFQKHNGFFFYKTYQIGAFVLKKKIRPLTEDFKKTIT